MGELGSVQTCKRIFKEQISEQGDIPFYKNGTIGLEPDSYISREVYEEFRRLYPYPEVGDTLMLVVLEEQQNIQEKMSIFKIQMLYGSRQMGALTKSFLRYLIK